VLIFSEAYRNLEFFLQVVFGLGPQAIILVYLMLDRQRTKRTNLALDAAMRLGAKYNDIP
jgi:hypothetical protein